MLVLTLVLLCASGCWWGAPCGSPAHGPEGGHSSARHLAGLFGNQPPYRHAAPRPAGLGGILVSWAACQRAVCGAAQPRGEVRFASRPADQGSFHPGVGEHPVPRPRLHQRFATASLLPSMEATPRSLRIAYPIRNPRRFRQLPQRRRSPSGQWGAGDRVRAAVRRQRRRPAPAPAALALAALCRILALVIWWVVRREVLKTPVGQLAHVAGRVADGDLSAPGWQPVRAAGWSRPGSESGRDDRPPRRDDPGGPGEGVFLQGLVDAAPDPMVVIGGSHRIVLANPGAVPGSTSCPSTRSA